MGAGASRPIIQQYGGTDRAQVKVRGESISGGQANSTPAQQPCDIIYDYSTLNRMNLLYTVKTFPGNRL